VLQSRGAPRVSASIPLRSTAQTVHALLDDAAARLIVALEIASLARGHSEPGGR